MRTSHLRLAGGLVTLMAWLGLSGCGGTSKTVPSDSSMASAPPPAVEAPVQEPIAVEEPAAIDFVAPTPEAIHFGFNDYQITAQAKSVLQDVSVVMKEHPDWTLFLEGHCDERGTDRYNLALGESRAEAAKLYLVSLGISPDRCETFSYGEERPIDLRSDEQAWAKNRRAELRLEGPEF